MFVSVLAMVAITLAAIVHDRKQMEGELNQMNFTLESQVVAYSHYPSVRVCYYDDIISCLQSMEVTSNLCIENMCRLENVPKNCGEQTLSCSLRKQQQKRLAKPSLSFLPT
jgi:hypothetical protein